MTVNGIEQTYLRNQLLQHHDITHATGPVTLEEHEYLLE